MLSEKPGDDINWKNRLEELDSLPGETFSGKTEAWEKLHLRLSGNSRRRKAAWYWIAAACLVFLILMPWSRSKKEPVLVKTNSVRNQRKILVSPPGPAYKVEAASSISRMPVKIKSDEDPVEKKGNRSNEGINTSKIASPGIYVTVSPTSPETPVIVNPVPSLDTNIVAIQPASVKKKLRVVHINELGVPVEDEIKDERYADRPSYYRRLTNQTQDLFSNASVNSRSFSNDLFKTKISPQN